MEEFKLATGYEAGSRGTVCLEQYLYPIVNTRNRDFESSKSNSLVPFNLTKGLRWKSRGP
jgi:hypothetical protein